MSGPSARYALPEEERAPIDQRAPELALSPPPEPAPAPPVATASTLPAERSLETTAAPRSLGRPLSPAIEVDVGELFRLHHEQGQILAELAMGYGDHRLGIVNSAAWRVRAAASRIAAITEPHKRRKQ
jgi:hypothetical protein